MAQMASAYYRQSITDVLRNLKAETVGLASTEAKRRSGTVSGSYTLLLGGKDTIKARSQEGGGPEAAESCISKAKIGLRRHSQGQKTTGGWKAGIANR